MLDVRLVLVWTSGWYNVGYSIGAFLHVPLMMYWMLRRYLGCKVGPISNVMLVFFWMFGWCYVGCQVGSCLDVRLV